MSSIDIDDNHPLANLSSAEIRLISAEPLSDEGRAILDRLAAQDENDYTPEATAAFEAEQSYSDYPEDR